MDNTNLDLNYTQLIVNSFMNDSSGTNVSFETLNEEELALKNLLDGWGFGYLFALLKCKYYFNYPMSLNYVYCDIF